MSDDWPSPPQRPERPSLPRVEDLPVVSEGFDRTRVEEAFDSFYRHIAQLDSTLRTLEAVEVFRRNASELRADLRSIRAAGWSPYPRGYPVAPELGRGYDLPAAVPRIALEVVFLIVVAVIVAVANFKSLEIVLVMVAAFAITALVEWLASLERRPEAPATAATPTTTSTPATEPEVQPGPVPEPIDEGAGWAAFAEPSGPEALTVMGALSDTDEEEQSDVAATPVLEGETDPEPVAEATEEFPSPVKREAEAGLEVAALIAEVEVVEPAAEPVSVVSEPEPKPESVSDAREPEPEVEEEPALSEEHTDEGSRHRWAWRRRTREALGRAEDDQEDGELHARAPKHVRILPPPEPSPKRELDPWERGFDFADDAAEEDAEAAAEEDEAPLRPQ